MAREESLVVIDDKQASTISGGGCGGLGLPVRRLSVAKGVSVVEWAALENQKSLRTLIINSRVNLKPGDSLACFSSLRVLYIWNADCNRLVASLVKLKHLRYLHLEATDISSLPDDIHKMKFLLSIMVGNSKKLGHLPSSIVNLVDLRFLELNGCNLSAVPKGFHGLTNLTTLNGFPVHVDGDVVGAGSRWCSLQELAPRTQLSRYLSLVGVEKVPSSSMAEEAKISSKGHLIGLAFTYSTGGGGVEQQQQQSVIQEEVLEKLCPPTCIELLTIQGGYLGRKLPDWIHAPASAAAFASLKSVKLVNLPCCTQLPDGLCYLPCLEMVTMENVTAVRRIGPEFQAFSSSSSAAVAAAASVPFPKLKELYLDGLRDWEWNVGCDEQGGMQAAIAMPCLEKLKIANCKLSRLPPGLANSNRHALRELYLYDLTNLISVENFPCVVQLDVFNCHELKRISSHPRLHRIRILCCSKLEAMEDVPTLDTMVLEDGTMETLPGYLQHVSPRYLQLACSKKLFDSLPPGSSARNEIGHIRKLYREVALSATS